MKTSKAGEWRRRLVTWGVPLWAVIVGPALFVPSLILGSMQNLADTLALVTLTFATLISRQLPSWLVGALALAVVAGGIRGIDAGAGGDHLPGIALGIFCTVGVAEWATSRVRLGAVTLAFLLVGLGFLALGARSSTVPHVSKFLPSVVLTQERPLVKLPFYQRLGRLYLNPNAIGVTALAILVVGAAVLTIPRLPGGLNGLLRGVALVAVGAGLIMVVASQSRAALSALAVILSVVAIGRLPAHMRRRGALALGLLIPVGLWVWWDSPMVASAQATLGARVTVWQEGLQALRTSPWLGIGLNAFRVTWSTAPHAHNIFLQTALDLGVVGLVCYLGWLGWVWRVVARLRAAIGADAFPQRLALGAGLALAGIHLYGLVDALALGTKLAILQWWAIGLVLAASALRSPVADNPP